MVDSPAAYRTSFSISGRILPSVSPVVDSSRLIAFGSIASSSFSSRFVIQIAASRAS